MLTKLTLQNFKQFDHAEVELGETVVLVGPNNSGKTTVLQALALWQLGARRWLEKRGASAVPEKRSGVAINRKDLIALPVPVARLLWRDLHVRKSRRVGGKPQTENIRFTLTAEGITQGEVWHSGLEFDYANEESFFCRPTETKSGQRSSVPLAAAATRVAFLPPMSGLAATETRLPEGRIDVLIGEGRTAEVLRNLCWQVLQADPDAWQQIVARLRDLFGVTLLDPLYNELRGEVSMGYQDGRGTELDLSSSGRGLQQTLLVLAYLQVNKGAVLLLDEPDAHLEFLRQRQIYQLLTDAAREHGSQIVAASHSEVLLNEAADRDVVVAFVGKPHRIDDRGTTQVRKWLKEIGFEAQIQAEQRGWVLYVEGSTDLAILRAFAEILNHPAKEALVSPFAHYVVNQISRAQDHFYGVREAKPDLLGVAVLDRDERSGDRVSGELTVKRWQRREIENYLCQPETLEIYAASLAGGGALPLFAHSDIERAKTAMRAAIQARVPPAALQNSDDAFWHDVKASEHFLDLVFAQFFESLGLPNLMRKKDYHELARCVPVELVSDEVVDVLDAVAMVAEKAKPAS